MKFLILALLTSTSVAFADDQVPYDPYAAPDQMQVIIAPPAVSPVMPAPAVDCNDLRGYAEPALFGGGESAEFRHGLGLDLGVCQEVSLKLGVRLDLGNLGSFAGGEAELLFGSPGARFGVNITAEAGTATRTSIGARVRLSNVWIGADLIRTTPNEMVYPYVNDRNAPETQMMFGFGLGGKAGQGFVKGELTALYVAGSILAGAD